VAELRLGDFEAEWGKKYPAIGPAWRRAWNEVAPFSPYPPQIRKMIYTTNAIKSLHRGLRKIIKNQRRLPFRRGGDEVALPGAEKPRQALETRHRMVSCLRPVHHLLPEALANYNPLTINPPSIARTQVI
jgi:hypothetical protein